MPYPSFSKINDDDMRALYAYFMHGVQPVAQAAPETQLPFPFSQRWALVFLEFRVRPTQALHAGSETRRAMEPRRVSRAIARALRRVPYAARPCLRGTRLYANRRALYLTGGTNDHWFAPNLTGDPGAGLGRLSADDIAAFLKTGHGAGLVTFGSMVQVVEDSTQYLDDRDLHAIA